MNFKDRKFICYWGGGYKEEVAIKTGDFFTPLKGYNSEAVRRIEQLEIRESTEFQMAGYHLIIRIQ